MSQHWGFGVAEGEETVKEILCTCNNAEQGKHEAARTE
jgi:hypothetical protein